MEHTPDGFPIDPLFNQGHVNDLYETAHNQGDLDLFAEFLPRDYDSEVLGETVSCIITRDPKKDPAYFHIYIDREAGKYRCETLPLIPGRTTYHAFDWQHVLHIFSGWLETVKRQG